MLDYQETERFIIGLEAFKGHDPEDYFYLVKPLSEFVFGNRFYNLSEVNKLAEAILVARPKTTSMEIGPSVTAQFLADRIKPWVEDIRQRLFHSKSPPFSRVEDAQIWSDEVEKGINELPKKVAEWRKRADEWHKRADEWHALWQATLEKYPLMKEGVEVCAELRKQGILVELPTQEEWKQLEEIYRYVKPFEVGLTPEVDEQAEVYVALLDELFEICVATGFTWKSVKMYILADASPSLPTFTLGIISETHSLPDDKSIQNRFARVDIRGDLTFEDLRSLYRGIRQELGITRSKRPTAKHLQLYQMVRRRGNIPSREGTVDFWRSIMKEWNDLPRQDKYNRWQDVKGAYERIIAHFERRIITKEAEND